MFYGCDLFIVIYITILLYNFCVAVKICENGGTLKNNICICPKNFYGNSCELQKQRTVSELSSYLTRCDHGRYDTATFSNPLKCKCHENWEGEHCDLPICKNGGKRSNHEKCECFGSWTGIHCNEKSCDSYREWSREFGKCVCKRKGWEGVRCHLPICGAHGRRIIPPNGTAFCECDSQLWFGERCNQSKCGEKGTPYFAQELSINNQSETVIKCECNKGWTGETCATKYCHGHGRPLWNKFCSCVGYYSMASDCEYCIIGWGGKDCNQVGNFDNYNGDNTYSYNNRNSNRPYRNTNAILVIVISLGAVALIASIACVCFKGCNPPLDSSPTTRTHVNPSTINLQFHRSRVYSMGNSVHGDAFEQSGTSYPGSNMESELHQNPTSTHPDTNFGPSNAVSQPADGEIVENEAPPPAYSDVLAAEPSPPNYEDAVKYC